MNVKIVKITKFSNFNSKELLKWVKWLNDKNVTKYSEQRFAKHTLSSQKNFLRQKIKDKNSYIFKILFKNIFIGVIELGKIDFIHSNCEIMYFIGEKIYWSKGIATEAINLALKYAKNLKIKKIYAGVYSNNLPSIKVLMKNKFKIEGKISNYYNFFSKKKIRIAKVILGLNL